MKNIWKALPATAKPLLGMEAAERLSYYSYRSICVSFLVTAWVVDPKLASGITQDNVALTYAMTFVGSLCADYFFGSIVTIIGFGLLCSAGHLLLSMAVQFDGLPFLQNLFSGKVDAYRAGLMLIGLGAGGLKPANSSLYGAQFGRADDGTLAHGWRFFYTAINVGSVTSFLATPLLAYYAGWDIAFGFAGIFMLLSVGVVLVWRTRLTQKSPLGYPPNNFFTVNARALRLFLSGEKEVWSRGLKQYFPAKSVDDQRRFWSIIGFFALCAVVAQGVYDLSGITWPLEAKKMDTVLWGVTVPAESIQVANPVFVVLLAPLSIVLFEWLRNNRGLDVPVERRMLWGILLIGLGTAINAVLADRIASIQLAQGLASDAPVALSAYYQWISYFVLSCGEVLFMAGGLEAAFKFAPPSMKSSVLSVWYLTTAAGNLLTARISYWCQPGQALEFLSLGGRYYWFLLALLALNLAVAWYWLTRRAPARQADAYTV